MNSVLVKLTEQSGEQKAMVEAVGKMVAELKLMQGKLDTVQNWQTENEQKYAEMHADYMEYKIKNEGTEGQQEGQLEAQTSAPTFTFGQTIPQTEQTVPTIVKAEPSAGQAQGAFAGQPKSSSPFVTPNSLLGNNPSSQQSGFGSDFTFPHTPLQQTRDNNPNSPPPPFPPPVGAGSSPAAPQNIFTTTTWKPKDPPCFHGKSTEDAHAWVAMVRNHFIFMLEPRNKKLHTQPHSYVMLHRSGVLVICGGTMGSIPMIGILWRKSFWSDLARTFVRRRHRPNCNTSMLVNYGLANRNIVRI